ncbi:MAG: hypothetical protein MZW92_41245 [Comamonadaceae bacterium]|nr:hypothetical protein [Comamonadaceae bacterium]
MAVQGSEVAQDLSMSIAQVERHAMSGRVDREIMKVGGKRGRGRDASPKDRQDRRSRDATWKPWRWWAAVPPAWREAPAFPVLRTTAILADCALPETVTCRIPSWGSSGPKPPSKPAIAGAEIPEACAMLPESVGPEAQLGIFIRRRLHGCRAALGEQLPQSRHLPFERGDMSFQGRDLAPVAQR